MACSAGWKVPSGIFGRPKHAFTDVFMSSETETYVGDESPIEEKYGILFLIFRNFRIFNNKSLLTMCLYSKQQDAKVAEKDIICYKLFFVIDELFNDKAKKTYKVGDITATYRQDYVYKFDKETGKAVEPKFIDHIEYASIFSNKLEYDISVGFHSYANLEDAQAGGKIFLGDRVTNTMRRTLVLYQCVIPKGAKYFEGDSSSISPGYCSDSIILGEQLTDYKPCA